MRNSFLLAMMVCLSALIAGASYAPGEEPKETPAAKPPVAKTKIAKLAALEIKGSLAESGGGMSLFGSSGSDLRGLLDRIEQASADKDVQGIVLQLRDPSLGMGRINELRAAIAKARKSGKKVYADVPSLSGSAYLVASACDEIIMPPSGALMITGVRAEVTFYKGLLSKVGIKADFLQMGKYKGAAESMTRSEMSGPFREQYEALLDDYYQWIVQSIAADRRLSADRVKELIDQGLFTARTAKEAGLIDSVAYEDQFHDRLRGTMNVDRLNVLAKYGKKKVDTDFSGPTGMFKLMQMMMGGTSGGFSTPGDKIAVVYAVGAITTGSSSSSIFGEQILGSDTIVEALRTANEDKTVKAIVLRVDSPGGSALASDLIWREISKIEKPVVASMGDVAASGGYYISMGCDRILAEPGTLTGSIGVVGGKLAFGGLYDKIGVNTQTIERGKNSGLFSTTSGFSKSERKAFRAMMEDIYEQFTTKAADGRKMDVEKLRSLAQGRIYSGIRAKENGLVDQIGTLGDAVTEAKKLAKLDPGAKIKLRILPKPKSIFEQLFESGDVEARQSVAMGIADAASDLSPELAKKLRDVQVLRKMFQQPVMLMLPYRVEVK